MLTNVNIFGVSGEALQVRISGQYKRVLHLKNIS